MEERFYLDDYTDEVVPCDCTLEGWAEWLSKPDPDWSRPIAATDGQSFPATRAEITEVECVKTAEGWTWPADIVAGLIDADATFMLRNGQGAGWWPDNSGMEPAEALQYAEGYEAGERAYLAAMVWRESVEIRFELNDDGPSCVIVASRITH
jgi:hypothetical protein